MNKLNQVWVIASNPSAVAELTTGAATLGENVVLLLAGNRESAVNANKVYHWPLEKGTQTCLNCLPEMVRLITENKPDLVLTDLSRNGRLAAAHVAAALGTNTMTDISELKVEEGRIFTKRMVYGGSAFKTESAQSPAVVCAGTGLFGIANTVPAGEIEEMACAENNSIKLKEAKVKVVQAVDLGAAKRVVSVGRGLGEEKNLALAESFAAAIEAELACSRPVAEEEKWLPKERYVGVSGQVIKPEVYIAVGISGQVQHIVGMNQAGTVVAINKDKSAPIFKQCDYGIVGDLRTVLPALEKKFAK